MPVIMFKGNPRVISGLCDIIDILRQDKDYDQVADYLEQYEKDVNAEIEDLNTQLDDVSKENDRLQDELDEYQ